MRSSSCPNLITHRHIQLLQSSLPYTERHFQRLDRLIQRSFILDYTLQSMQLQADDAKLGPAESESTAVPVTSNTEPSAKKRKRSLEPEAASTTKKQKINGEKATKKSPSKHK